MLNKELYTLNPEENNLANDGVVEINTGKGDAAHRLLQYELKSFVCEGEYQRGLYQILSQYLKHFSGAKQPAVWVSGFFGSGKSHLVKMLGNLWENFAFPDGTTARTVKPLPQEIADLLQELEQKQRIAGRLTVMASLKDSSAKDIRYKFVQLLLEALGLPVALHQFRFLRWLKAEGITEAVKQRLSEKGKTIDSELNNMFVSTGLSEAILNALPGYAENAGKVKEALSRNFERVETLGKQQFLDIIRTEILPWNFGNKIPCTLIILDEVQQFIANDPQQSLDVQNLTEELSSSFDGKLMVVGTGQNALSDVELLSRLQDRFSVKINLTNTDVETVTRRTILDKKATAVKPLTIFLDGAAGEIDKLLHGSSYGATTADKSTMVADYPVLPPVRKFWKRLLMHLDKAGTTGQLRSQLRIVDDSVKATASLPLGHVVPADYIFGQKQSQLLMNAVLLNETNNLIESRLKGDNEQRLEGRILASVFLIDQFRDDNTSDKLKSNAATIADLLLDDLTQPSGPFRSRVESGVQKLLSENLLMPVGDEVKLQTKAGQEWEQKFRLQQQKLDGSGSDLIPRLRRDKLSAWFNNTARGIAVLQGAAKQKREHEIWDKLEAPSTDTKLNLWLRDGWTDNDKTLMDEIRAAGTDKPLAYAFALASKAQDTQLKKALADYLAAQAVLEKKGTAATPEGEQARKSMETRRNNSMRAADELIEKIGGATTLYTAGGAQVTGDSMRSSIQLALEAVASRQFKDYSKADVTGWEKALGKALQGIPDAIQAIGFKSDPQEHPVAVDILRFIGNTPKAGKDIQQTFTSAPYGWPRDAVDAMLIMLLNSQHLSSPESSFTQSKIRNATFRRETHTLGTADKMVLRKLFANTGVTCPPGGEATAATSFLQALLRLADGAGGDAPRPEPVSTDAVSALQALEGTQQLIQMAAQNVELQEWHERWTRDGMTIAAREPAWNLLLSLLSAAPDNTLFNDIRAEVAAIRSNRLLLQEPDLVAPLLQRTAEALNAEVKAHITTYLAEHRAGMDALAQTDYWPKLSPEKKHSILAGASLLHQYKTEHLGPEALRDHLQKISLEAWQSKIDALPRQFDNARTQGLKEAEPEAKTYRPPHRIIRNTAELDLYLADLKTVITDMLKSGTIVDLS